MAAGAESTERLFVQMQLELEDIKADAAENELEVELAVAKMTIVDAFARMGASQDAVS